MKYTVIVEEDKVDGGYFAQVPELDGCFTQADSLDELKVNIQEAILISKEDERENKSSNFIGVWELEVNRNAAAPSH